jgi:para-nitrobenzyl esterase
MSETVAWSKSNAEATAIARNFLKILDVRPENHSALEQIPAERLIEAASSLNDGQALHFMPVFDGVMLSQTPLQAIANGAAKNIPLLMGTTKDESLFYPFADPSWREADEETLIQRGKQEVGATWEKVAPFYLQEQPAGQVFTERLFALLTFDRYTFPTIKLAEAQSKQGGPVWVYRFDWYSLLFGGAAHTLDRLFVWNLVASSLPMIQRMAGDAPEQLHLAHQMQRAWIAFARCGDPNTPELPVWPRYDLEQRATMLFNRESTVQNDPNAMARQHWTNAVSPV